MFPIPYPSGASLSKKSNQLYGISLNRKSRNKLSSLSALKKIARRVSSSSGVNPRIARGDASKCPQTGSGQNLNTDIVQVRVSIEVVVTVVLIEQAEGNHLARVS